MARRKIDKWLTPEGLIKIRGWALAGLTDEQIAGNIGVSRSTLAVWRKEHAELDEAIREEKETADFVVQNELYRNATGYEYEEQQAIKVKSTHYDENGKKIEEERVELVTVKRWKPAETTAQIYWLNNRMADVWRQKVIAETAGATTVVLKDWNHEDANS